jgi:ribonuclease I
MTRTSVWRWIVGAAALGASSLTGCAGTEQRPTDTAANLSAAAAGGTQVEDAETLKAAMEAGYRLVNEDGVRMYCKRETETGSRVRARTVCLTGEQIRDLSANTKEWIDNASRSAQQPKGAGP